MTEASSSREVQRFGFTLGGALLLLGVFAAWRGQVSSRYFFAVGAAVVLSGIITPKILRPVKKSADLLIRSVSRALTLSALFLLYFGIFTPWGWVLRHLGKSPLDLRWGITVKSYWHTRPQREFAVPDYEKQF